MVDEALTQMSGRFDEIYGSEGRPSIAPERLLRALLLQMLYSVRSECPRHDQNTGCRPTIYASPVSVAPLVFPFFGGPAEPRFCLGPILRHTPAVGQTPPLD